MFELWCTLQKLAELKEPIFMQNDFSTSQKQVDIVEVKKKALEILQNALSSTPEEAMARCLLEDGESTTYDLW